MVTTIQAGIGLNFFGFFLDIVGVVTTNWLRTYKYHFGLFKACYINSGACSSVNYYGAYKTMQSLSSLGFLLLLIVTIMVAVYLCRAALRENIRYKKALGGLMITGGLLAFLGAMFGVGGSNYKPSWSLFVAATGGIISFISGILVLIPNQSMPVS